MKWNVMLQNTGKIVISVWIVAGYFLQMRKNNCYVAKPETIKHVYELLELITVLTNDQCFMDVCNTMGKEAATICEVLDQIENKGIEKRIGNLKRAETGRLNRKAAFN